MLKEIVETIKFIVPILAPVLAGYIGIRYGLKQIREQKRLDFIEKQLNQFYSPLLGIHNEIQAKKEVMNKINKIGNKIWEDKCRTQEHNKKLKLVDKEIKYNKKQIAKELFPQYNQMLLIFKENYCFAEPETKKHYYELVEFVEIWNRSEKV